MPRDLTEANLERVGAAIRAAEARTSGEIYCVVTDRPGEYTETGFAVAAFAAFTLPLVLVLFGFAPWNLVPAWAGEEVPLRLALEAFVAFQILVFFAVLALMLLTDLKRRLTPAPIRRRRLHRMALDQFFARSLHETDGRTGVLLFANTTEHHAEVVADSAIYARVPIELWGDTVAAMVEGARRGALADGFVEAVGMAAAVLAEHFPPGALNPNELPDHLVVI